MDNPQQEYPAYEAMFCYLALPLPFARSKDFSPIQKLVFARLAFYARTRGIAWPKQTTLAEDLGLEVKAIRNAIRVLVERGLIRAVLPDGKDKWQHKTTRYTLLKHPVFIETQPTEVCVVEEGDDLLGTSSVPNEAPQACLVNNSVIKESNSPPSAEGGGSVIKKPSKLAKVWIRLAQQLMDAISRAKKSHFSTQQRTSWARELEKLHSIHRIKLQHIKKVMNWYCSVFSERWQTRYYPKAFSGSAFHEKFDSVENAMYLDSGEEAARQGLDEAPRKSKLPEFKPKIVATYNMDDPKDRARYEADYAED